jgi:hypothetical protein
MGWWKIVSQSPYRLYYFKSVQECLESVGYKGHFDIEP